MGFRENLKLELNYRGMPVKELSRLSGVHKRALDTYLREKASMPPADSAVKIAKVLGVTVEYLITGENIVPQQDIQMISSRLYNLSPKNRKAVAVLVDALSYAP
ncbi:MAG: helix-turn-helix transcriptional regulator [Termitinemataceae bacterium]|nr:MAG: helix-turn-helix transcriptional regulator [Termitinemataceae bacterium]